MSQPRKTKSENQKPRTFKTSLRLEPGIKDAIDLVMHDVEKMHVAANDKTLATYVRDGADGVNGTKTAGELIFKAIKGTEHKLLVPEQASAFKKHFTDSLVATNSRMAKLAKQRLDLKIKLPSRHVVRERVDAVYQTFGLMPEVELPNLGERLEQLRSENPLTFAFLDCSSIGAECEKTLISDMATADLPVTHFRVGSCPPQSKVCYHLPRFLDAKQMINKSPIVTMHRVEQWDRTAKLSLFIENWYKRFSLSGDNNLKRLILIPFFDINNSIIQDVLLALEALKKKSNSVEVTFLKIPNSKDRLSAFSNFDFSTLPEENQSISRDVAERVRQFLLASEDNNSLDSLTLHIAKQLNAVIADKAADNSISISDVCSARAPLVGIEHKEAGPVLWPKLEMTFDVWKQEGNPGYGVSPKRGKARRWDQLKPAVYIQSYLPNLSGEYEIADITDRSLREAIYHGRNEYPDFANRLGLRD